MTARYRSTVTSVGIVLALTVCALLGAGVAASMYIGVLVLFGVAVLVSWFFPYIFVFFTAMSFLFMRTLVTATGVEAFGLLDETCVVVCFMTFVGRRLVEGNSIRPLPGYKWVLVFAVIGYASAVISGVPFATFMSGSLLILKGVALAFAVSQLEWRERHLVGVVRCGAITVCFILLCTIVNLLIPDFWLGSVLNAPDYGRRFGLEPVLGPFIHPGYFGSIMAMAAVAIVAYRAYVRKGKLSSVLLVGAIVTMFLTLRRKVVVGFIGGVSHVVVQRYGRFSLAWVGCALVVVGILFWGAIADVVAVTYSEYLADHEQVARIRLYIDGWSLAVSNFPFGTGFGRFGSATARSTYSPIYYELGYPAIWGLGPTEESGKFLTDTFWPGVVAETGLLGLLAFGMFLLTIFRFSRHAVKREHRRSAVRAWIAAVFCGWTVQLLVESVAGAVFTAAPTYGLYFGLLGILVALSNSDEGRFSPTNSSNSRAPELQGSGGINLTRPVNE